ncbi:DEAD/DEAH box helicase [Trichlorobacter ammonificans]|uniref:DNA 3'-5' helicase II n=1 Tax=Trichlorobacter ammonificans TaxID=2916410 RepID=A0ABM9D900_9BACT|nr:nuclease-related domain-containing DEAD/DEAH box helicase [Trichlorobacter ammonificans]CAH2031691.1 DNA helicase [Trichlorobacter ammonificans]
MSILIPSISTCKFATSGERRFARLLEAKLEDDYLCWYNVPIGPKRLHPDFIIMHPRRGILILEVKDWRLSTITSLNHHEAELIVHGQTKNEKNPLEQAREYTTAVVNILQTDPQLIHSEGRYQGKLLFPWACGVVLTNITRKEYEQTDLEEVIDSRWIIFKDEMTESVDAMTFQERLWGMFPFNAAGMLTLPQIERVRWHLFPEVRLPYKQASLFDALDDEPQALPDIMRVMDLQQEQLARSLGEGHRVIHGVAGSGKTMILGYRAEHLAKVCTRPILILCYNKVLAHRLQQWMEAKGIADKVQVYHFHAWCYRQLKTYNIPIPPSCSGSDDFCDELVDTVIRQVDRKMIPAGQYDAVMIDEGHDFRSEWLKLVVQMVNPSSNSLLVLYDDAQSIYDTRRKGKFSFKSVGIQAQGRTTILRINYRNTDEILNFAARFVQGQLTQEEADEDGIPRLAPVPGGRRGSKPVLIKLPTIPEEADAIAQRLKEAHHGGVSWKDMAVLFWDAQDSNELYRALCDAGIPFAGKDKLRFNNKENRVGFLSCYSCKGLEFPLVAVMGSRISEQAKTDAETAKLLYVAMTRATEHLVMTVGEQYAASHTV